MFFVLDLLPSHFRGLRATVIGSCQPAEDTWANSKSTTCSYGCGWQPESEGDLVQKRKKHEIKCMYTFVCPELGAAVVTRDGFIKLHPDGPDIHDHFIVQKGFSGEFLRLIDGHRNRHRFADDDGRIVKAITLINKMKKRLKVSRKNPSR